MELIGVFISTFVIVYLIYFCLVLLNKRMLKKFMNGTEVKYLKSKYKIKVKDEKRLAYTIIFTNSFILALTFVLVYYVENLIYKLLLGFVLLIPLILITYHFLGKYYNRKKR